MYRRLRVGIPNNHFTMDSHNNSVAWKALFIWIAGTLAVLILGFEAGWTYAFDPKNPKKADAEIWRLVLFGSPYYLAAYWFAITAGCVYFTARSRRRK